MRSKKIRECIRLQRRVTGTWPRVLSGTALLVTFGLASLGHTQKPTTQGSGEDEQMFAAYCGSCHGLDGHGGQRAPDIVGRREVQGLSDTDLQKIIRNGIAGTGMPPFGSLGDSKVQALVRELRRLQGQGGPKSLPGSPEAGKVLFFHKAGCSECHMVNGIGGFVASDLSRYGEEKSAEEVREAIIKPEAGGQMVVATTVNGETFTGVVRNEDNFSVQIQSTDGTFRFFEKSSLKKLERKREPLMPTDYASRLSSDQIKDIVSYLMSGGKKRESRPQSGAEDSEREKESE